MGVAVGRFDVEGAFADLEDRDVECAAAEVVDGDHLLIGLIQPIGESSGGWLVDDAQDVQPSNLSGGLRRLTLRVVEVGGDGDHGLGHLVAEVGLGVGLQLLQDHGADLRRRVRLVAHPDARVAVLGRVDLVRQDPEVSLHLRVVEAAAHEALDREHRVVRVRDALALRDLPDQPLAVF